jgi:DNA replication initiation complex subunit (GINS family)
VARQTFQRASQIARDIVEARMTKLLSAAFQTSVGGGRDLANALAEERALFDGLVERLRGFRAKVAPYLEPTGGSAPAASPRAGASSPEAPASARPPSIDAGGPSSSADAPTARSAPGPPRGYVRILRDSRPIELPGETLELRKEDVVSLPLDVARLLVEGRVAEWIEPASRRAVT